MRPHNCLRSLLSPSSFEQSLALVRRGCRQCMCCGEQSADLDGTKNQSGNQTKPRHPMFLWALVGGTDDCSCDTDTAVCRVTFHNTYCKMMERPSQAAINLLPLLPLDHFAVNCRSFKRFKLQFSQNKTIILSYLKMQGCGQKRLVIIMPSY